MSALGFQPHTKTATTLIREYVVGEDLTGVSISPADKANGHPKQGDMIGRAKDDETDLWLINQGYYKENYKLSVTFLELMGENLGKG